MYSQFHCKQPRYQVDMVKLSRCDTATIKSVEDYYMSPYAVHSFRDVKGHNNGEGLDVVENLERQTFSQPSKIARFSSQNTISERLPQKSDIKNLLQWKYDFRMNTDNWGKWSCGTPETMFVMTTFFAIANEFSLSNNGNMPPNNVILKNSERKEICKNNFYYTYLYGIDNYHKLNGSPPP